MKITHIGGAIDGCQTEINDSVRNGQISFKLSSDFPSDPLRTHDYVRRTYMVRDSNGILKQFDVMVLENLPDEAAKALIEHRLQVRVVS